MAIIDLPRWCQIATASILDQLLTAMASATIKYFLEGYSPALSPT